MLFRSRCARLVGAEGVVAMSAPEVNRTNDGWSLTQVLPDDYRAARPDIEQLLLELMDLYEQTDLGDRLSAAYAVLVAVEGER